MDVVRLQPINGQLAQVGDADGRRILEVASGGEGAAPEVQVVAARHRLERRQGDLLEGHPGLHGWVRHRQKIRLPLEREGARVDDRALDVEVGGIHARG